MRNYLKEHPAAFDHDEVAILVGAFDQAWQLILKSGAKLDGELMAVRELLAKRIIEVAKQGERDQRRLCEDALAHLAASGLKKVPRPLTP
jgi:hypothetical protein